MTESETFSYTEEEIANIQGKNYLLGQAAGRNDVLIELDETFRQAVASQMTFRRHGGWLPTEAYQVLFTEAMAVLAEKLAEIPEMREEARK